MQRDGGFRFDHFRLTAVRPAGYSDR
jgi:hypothetical protein